VTAHVPTLDDFEALVERVADLEARLEDAQPEPSPYLTIPETADYLRCSRQRVDDLLSQRRLTRHKDGARTLVSRAEVHRYLNKESRR
jgi:excisionase family DNA binding protein